MRKFFNVLLALILALSSFSLIACKKGEDTEIKTVRVCNCEDYIDETLFEEFTEETGIEVIYSTYGTNENLYNELVINPNSYDLVVPSEYMIEKLAEEGRIQKLDFTKLEGYKQNVSPYIENTLKDLRFTVKDGEHEGEEASLDEYTVGYMWGTMGWVYNTEFVSTEDVSSWHGPFENVDLSGKITIKDAVRDSYIVGLAMTYEEELNQAVENGDNQKISEILNRIEKENIDAVGETLTSLKSMLYGFEVDSGKNDIILGNINAYVAWSGDAAYAIDVAAGDAEDEDGTVLDESATRSLGYYIPDEGSNIWFDGFVMPSGSTNYDATYKFLEFITRPESVYRNMDYTGYTSIVANGDFTLYDEETEEEYQTSLFDEVVLGWFDETEYLLEDAGKDDVSEITPEEMTELGYMIVDLSYFYGVEDGEYTVLISEEGYGRLIAQYPTLNEISRCAVMKNFSSDALMDINDMWESVKGTTFATWFIMLVVGLVIVLGVVMVLLRHKDKIKIFRLPEHEDKLIKKGYKIVKKEKI